MVACDLSSEDCDALMAWHMELVSRGEVERAALLRRAAVAGGLRRLSLESSVIEVRPRSSLLGEAAPAVGGTGPGTEPTRATLAESAQAVEETLQGKVAKRAQVVDESVGCGPAALGPRHTFSLATLSSGLSPRRHSSLVPMLPPVVSFVAEPSVLLMSRASLLKSSLGEWLARRNLMAPLLLVVALLIVLTMALEPLAEDVPADGPLYVRHGESGETLELRVKRPGEFTWIATTALSVFLWFLMLHNINRDMFLKVLYTFDAMIIVASFFIGKAARLYDLFSFWGSRGYVDEAWVAFEVLDAVLVTLPSALILASMDSWKVASWFRGEGLSISRIMLAALATVVFAKNYFDTILPPGVQKWSREPACLGSGLCKDPREIYATSEMQSIIFLSKAIFKYSMGWPFAFIKPSYGLNDEQPKATMVSMVAGGAGTVGRRLMTAVGVQPSIKSTTAFPEAAADGEDHSSPCDRRCSAP